MSAPEAEGCLFVSLELEQQRARGLAFFMVLDCGMDKEAFHFLVQLVTCCWFRTEFVAHGEAS